MPKRIILTLICTLSLLSAAFAQPPDDINTYNNPKLESLLMQMISSDDPKLFASTHGFTTENSNIRVIIEMANGTAMLPDYIIEETRQSNKIQAMVPIEKISTLSQEPDVIFIRLPSKPIADTIKPAPSDKTNNPKSGFSSTLIIIFSIILIFEIKKKGDVTLVKK